MSTDNVRSYAESLKNRLWITKGSRFNAARRLNNKSQFSTTSISILSVYGIAIPIIQSLPNISKCSQVNSLYTAISTILSVFTLVLSLLDSAKNYPVKADRIYNSAVKIGVLEKKLEYLICCEADDEFRAKVQFISTEYNEILAECGENHDPEDFALFKAQHSKDFNIKTISKNLIKLKVFVKDYWIYVFVLGLPPIIALLYTSC
jgi:low affinity Fe/Cu permease